MTLIELMTSIAVFLMFVFAIVPAVQPAFDIMVATENDRKFASSIVFLQKTFEKACIDGKNAVDYWEDTMVYIDGISEITVRSVHKKTDYQLFRADCVLYGQHIFILGIYDL